MYIQEEQSGSVRRMRANASQVPEDHSERSGFQRDLPRRNWETGPSLGGSKPKLPRAGVTEVIVTDGPRKLVPGQFAALAVAASGAESMDWRLKATGFPCSERP